VREKRGHRTLDVDPISERMREGDTTMRNGGSAASFADVLIFTMIEKKEKMMKRNSIFAVARPGGAFPAQKGSDRRPCTL